MSNINYFQMPFNAMPFGSKFCGILFIIEATITAILCAAVHLPRVKHKVMVHTGFYLMWPLLIATLVAGCSDVIVPLIGILFIYIVIVALYCRAKGFRLNNLHLKK